MRVAVVTESFLPTVNGVTNSVCKVLDHLERRGHEAIVITPAAGSPKHYGSFRVHQVPAFAYRQFPVGLPSPQVQRLIDDFAPDVVHAASPFLLGGQALFAAKLRRVPSIAVFQTDVAGYTKRNRLRAMEDFAWWVIRLIHNSADLTLAPSSASIADLEDAGIGPLERWGRGVDLERYHPRNKLTGTSQRLRKRLRADENVIVGYVGRLAPEKQAERLASLRDIPGMQLVVVGDGPSTESVKRALKGMPVHFAGRLSGADLAHAYASFDVFVHTGTEETFGQTLQEAHASGVPVVAPYAGGPIDLIDHGTDGYLFNPRSEGDADLRHWISELVADSDLRARMGEAGRRRVLDRSWERICDELIGHYELVIAERQAIESRRPASRFSTALSRRQ
ncbi:GDP-mannose-dependent alpha-mannosyltransferase [Pseudoclavibacter endophyticus]|uniref:D-inositol 3-phosphate glycosyltransferase n=1 Tax=Pseudoclavibacter endophyticus TaxID=1778590 RepID=A0A6H9WN44_9MICO|nr:glycosyltransferase family 1 protein [Pseudoclavibacter endophyticus]KAB1648178.1 glycosyltransferase family 1 protein [Pseudoclavibacter endophyticus]GGA70393.1 GDP-mannose-dependent alpha-mannosyltransferase [Pseudoclavibacter endophyticus]